MREVLGARSEVSVRTGMERNCGFEEGSWLGRGLEKHGCGRLERGSSPANRASPPLHAHTGCVN